MPLSDREVKNVLSFYVGLRRVVLVVGATVIVAAVLAVVALVYDIGRKDGGHAAAASSSPDGQTVPKPKPRVGAKPDALEHEEAEEAATGEGGAEPAGSDAGTGNETAPDPLAVQSSDAAGARPAPGGGSVSPAPGDGESPDKETHPPSSENGLTKRLKQIFREPKQN
jgi:hypothetical protein